MPTLTWLNDDQARKTSAHIPYRLLEHDPAEKSGGKALFLMAVERDEQGRDVYQQIEDAISTHTHQKGNP